MMGLEIRELKPEDYEEMSALWERAGLSYRPQGRDSRAAIAAQMRRDPDLFLGACAGGRLVGIVIGSDDGRKGWINRLAVDPAYRRRGIAQALIAEVERRLRGRGREIIAVLVEEWNQPSLALFQGCGYLLDRTILYLSKRTAPWV
ncbi:MAG: GNAT family N-acetyltransferase [Candidatus Bipolaricaulia bacterium]